MKDVLGCTESHGIWPRAAVLWALPPLLDYASRRQYPLQGWVYFYPHIYLKTQIVTTKKHTLRIAT